MPLNMFNDFRKTAWKPLIYLFDKQLETLETYSPVKLQLNLSYNVLTEFDIEFTQNLDLLK